MINQFGGRGKPLFAGPPKAGGGPAQGRKAREDPLERLVGEKRLRLVEGDITEMETQAIVNAANENLVLGGGVAGAIRTKGGPRIQKECNAIGPTPVGRAALTTAGELKADYVIHAVGPRWGEGNEEQKLESAIRSSLELASQHGLTSVALPAVSTGIFGFPLKKAAEISIRTALGHLRGATSLKEIVFCLYGREAFGEFAAALERAQPAGKGV